MTLPHDEQAMLIDKQPYDDRPIDVNGDNARLYMGGVLGGSTSLYGAALMRPSDDDFHPGRHYGDRLDKSIHDWPIGYEDLAPYYDRAEQLYHVSGQSSPNFGPLNRPSQDYPHSPIPLKPINERLVNGNESAGLKPFVLPLGIDFNICLQCDACPGYICPNGARISAGQVIEQAAADTGSLEIRERVEVEKFERQGEAITGVRILERETGEHQIVTAKRYVLAGGSDWVTGDLIEVRLRSSVDRTKLHDASVTHCRGIIPQTNRCRVDLRETDWFRRSLFWGRTTILTNWDWFNRCPFRVR